MNEAQNAALRKMNKHYELLDIVGSVDLFVATASDHGRTVVSPERRWNPLAYFERRFPDVFGELQAEFELSLPSRAMVFAEAASTSGEAVFELGEGDRKIVIVRIIYDDPPEVSIINHSKYTVELVLHLPDRDIAQQFLLDSFILQPEEATTIDLTGFPESPEQLRPRIISVD